jgi:hypothetical protein
MRNNTSSLMDGSGASGSRFTEPKFKEFGPSAQAKKEYKDRKYRIALLVLVALVFAISWFFALNRNNAIVKESIKNIDSLKNELFIEQINVQRYEIVIDRIKDEDSVLYEKIEKYLSETE